MTRPLLHLLSDEERATLHEQTLTVLEEVGVAYDTTAAVEVLEGTGAVLYRDHLSAGEAAARRCRSPPRRGGGCVPAPRAAHGLTD